MKQNKTLGIIGGVGPQTTTEIYLEIINRFKRYSDKYPEIIIYNLPFPFAIEEEAIVKGKNADKMIPYLIQGAKILEKSGADFGILPCNTLHKYIDSIRKAVKIPFLSILEETVSVLKKKNIKSVGILGTQTSVKDKLYESILLKNKIDFIYPSVSEQNQINKIIMNLIEGDINAENDKSAKIICLSLGKRGAKAILLACTDLQALNLKSIGMPIVDTTYVLIEAAQKRMGV